MLIIHTIDREKFPKTFVLLRSSKGTPGNIPETFVWSAENILEEFVLTLEFFLLTTMLAHFDFL